jgi:toxin-antitoxin system PIN domain toxin
VIALDVNLLIYAFSTFAPEHERARGWLDGELRNGTQIAVPWESTMGFVRLMSGRHVVPEAISVADAWAKIHGLLQQPNVWVPTPTPQHAQVFSELLQNGRFSNQDVPDIHLAALTISHGLKLASHDKGFARFDGLRWFDPIAA